MKQRATRSVTQRVSSSTKPVRAVERALKILFFVAENPKAVSLTEVSRKTGLDKATALRLLATLEDFQLVRKDPRTRCYAPGLGVWRLPRGLRDDLREIARPYLETLRRQTNETVSLIIPRGFERVVIDVVATDHELAVVPAVGTSLPVYCGAAGKVIMAFMEDDERDHVIRETGLKPLVPSEAVDRAAFLDVLRRVRQDGYARSIGDVTVGTSALAAPVFDDGQRVVGCVALRGPEIRMTMEHMATLAPLVLEVCGNLSGKLGFLKEERRTA